MALASKISFVLALAVATGSVAVAQEHGRPEARSERPPAHGEPHAGPSRYHRVAEPEGWNNRPNTVDKGHYNHNFQASRSYRIGVYRRPPGWRARRWGYGEILPRVYWTAPYIIADYWLFALDVPPVGYEWVRDDTDAILVNITTGEILQVEYGVFS